MSAEPRTYRDAVPVARDRPGRLDPASRRCPATATPTWRSSAPASPGSGPRSTSRAPTRPCGSPCSRPRPPASARRGRNGGWCSALFPSSLEYAGRAARLQPRRRAGARTGRCGDSVDEVMPRGRGRGHRRPDSQGRHDLAGPHRRPAGRARAEVEEARAWGRGEDDLRLLDADEAPRPCWRGTRTVGATYTPDCAAIHPGRLVRGLADAVVRRGGTLHEQTPATAIAPGAVAHRHGTVRAERVIRATEGYTRTLDGQRGPMVPVYSLIIATEPLPTQTWEQIGLRRARDVQRPPAPDHLRPAHRRRPAGLRRPRRAVPLRLADPAGLRPRRRGSSPRCTATLVDLFPVLQRGADHPRLGRRARHRPRLDRLGRARPGHRAGLGRRVRRRRREHDQPGRPDPRDLVLGHDTELTRLPWVDHHSRSWEPEPLRWLGRQRRAARDDPGRRRGAAHRPAQPAGEGDVPAARRPLAHLSRGDPPIAGSPPDNSWKFGCGELSQPAPW